MLVQQCSGWGGLDMSDIYQDSCYRTVTFVLLFDFNAFSSSRKVGTMN